jgi:hypothetical protein
MEQMLIEEEEVPDLGDDNRLYEERVKDFEKGLDLDRRCQRPGLPGNPIRNVLVSGLPDPPYPRG